MKVFLNGTPTDITDTDLETIIWNKFDIKNLEELEKAVKYTSDCTANKKKNYLKNEALEKIWFENEDGMIGITGSEGHVLVHFKTSIPCVALNTTIAIKPQHIKKALQNLSKSKKKDGPALIGYDKDKIALKNNNSIYVFTNAPDITIPPWRPVVDYSLKAVKTWIENVSADALIKAIEHVVNLQEIKNIKEPMIHFYVKNNGILIQNQASVIEDFVPIERNTADVDVEWFIINPSLISKAIQPFEHENVQMGIPKGGEGAVIFLNKRGIISLVMTFKK